MSKSSERMDAVLRALEAGDTARAVTLADAALSAGDENPLFLNLSAFGSEEVGELDAAFSKLRRAVQLKPDDVLILTALGNILSKLGRWPEALAGFEAALMYGPGHAPAHHGRGLALTGIGNREEEARHSYLRAADLDPNYPDPLGALADDALSNNRTDVAKVFAERALALQPGQPAASMVMAALDSGAGRHEEAMARVTALLRTPLSPLHRAAAEQSLGEELEHTGRLPESLAAIIRGAALTRQTYTRLYEQDDVETGVQFCGRLQRYFSAADPTNWAPVADHGDDVKGHVFLLGFVRSGTTLLEQVLTSHPDVVALEEKATLRAITPEFFATNGGLDRLARLGPAEAEALRADYWRRVRSFDVETAGKVFVDKAPLSTIYLPMIAKLFPNARVLFAVRDPRDVVVSAFKHRFLINALTWGFTDLKATAEFYAAVMDVAAIYRAKLPLTLYQHRHEDLVEDFDAEVGRICEFLGLEWTDSLRDFAETAKRRDVRTPSAAQVRGGLSSQGVGRWRRYGPAVEPILPILKDWVARYGYAPDDGTVGGLDRLPMEGVVGGAEFGDHLAFPERQTGVPDVEQ